MSTLQQSLSSALRAPRLQTPAGAFARVSIGRYACFSVLLLGLAACKSAPPDDATLTRGVQSSLASDGSLTGLGIQANVQGGVATLTGSAQNDAQRSLAARDASGIQGVHEVVNNIELQTAPPASATASAPPPAAVAAPIENTTGQISPGEARRQRELERRHDAEDRQRQQQVERSQREFDRQQQQNNQPPAPIERAQSAPPPQPVYNPPPPPQPVFRDITVPAGYAIAVRVTQTLDSADAVRGQTFSGVVANDVMADGVVAIPAGTHVAGQVDNVQDAGHFKGSSLLTVSLSSANPRGERVAIATEPYTVEGKGRGKNTLEKTGGGAAVGAILGGIFGGGKGAAVGAAAGGGVGAGSNAITRGQQIQIQSESIVRFRLTRPIPLHVRADGQAGEAPNTDPSLQRHP